MAPGCPQAGPRRQVRKMSDKSRVEALDDALCSRFRRLSSHSVNAFLVSSCMRREEAEIKPPSHEQRQQRSPPRPKKASCPELRQLRIPPERKDVEHPSKGSHKTLQSNRYDNGSVPKPCKEMPPKRVITFSLCTQPLHTHLFYAAA